MRNEQLLWTAEDGWSPEPSPSLAGSAELVWVFGSPSALTTAPVLDELRERYPGARLFGCSTAGEIRGTTVCEDTLVSTAVAFDSTTIESAQVQVSGAHESQAAGRTLAEGLPADGLRHVVVLSDGVQVNGSALVAGLTEHLPDDVTVTGGLSGDGARFERTIVVSNGSADSHRIAALGLYGKRLEVGYGSLGGWDAFGPERLVTRSSGNVLFELDGRSALELYKEYLGEHADGLPATGLLFPLSVRSGNDRTPVVRTILSIDDDAGSMVFAGDVPQGTHARLMKANFNRLVDGAAGAARTSSAGIKSAGTELALLISCVGRKLVLKQRVEEEVESVREVLGSATTLMGFYSYGEISPFTANARCELHNQTMTITTFSEN